MLKVKLGDSEIRTFQADREAVVLIAGKAVEMSGTTDVSIAGKAVEMLETTDVSIAGEDINLMDLLMAKAETHKDIISIIPSETTFLGRAVSNIYWMRHNIFRIFKKHHCICKSEVTICLESCSSLFRPLLHHRLRTEGRGKLHLEVEWCSSERDLSMPNGSSYC